MTSLIEITINNLKYLATTKIKPEHFVRRLELSLQAGTSKIPELQALYTVQRQPYQRTGDYPKVSFKVLFQSENRDAVRRLYMEVLDEHRDEYINHTNTGVPAANRCKPRTLTLTQINNLRSERGSYSLRDLANKYGISHVTVRNICNRETYTFI